MPKLSKKYSIAAEKIAFLYNVAEEQFDIIGIIE